MYIHEAIKAMKEGRHPLPCIRRKCWPYSQLGIDDSTSVKIIPTNGPDLCIIHSKTVAGVRAGWQPCKDDLIADDWEPCM